MSELAPPDRGAVGADAPELLETRISRPTPGAVVLDVRGEIDSLTAPEFSAAVNDLVAVPADTLVVDLSGVRFLASSGLAVLIAGAQRTDERAVRLRLVVTTRAVRRPLEITGTDQLFELHPDIESAIGGRD